MRPVGLTPRLLHGVETACLIAAERPAGADAARHPAPGKGSAGLVIARCAARDRHSLTPSPHGARIGAQQNPAPDRADHPHRPATKVRVLPRRTPAGPHEQAPARELMRQGALNPG